MKPCGIGQELHTQYGDAVEALSKFEESYTGMVRDTSYFHQADILEQNVRSARHAFHEHRQSCGTCNQVSWLDLKATG